MIQLVILTLPFDCLHFVFDIWRAGNVPIHIFSANYIRSICTALLTYLFRFVLILFVVYVFIRREELAMKIGLTEARIQVITLFAVAYHHIKNRFQK